MTRVPVPIAVPFLVMFVGLAFVVIGLARPDFFWELGKLRTSREMIGDPATAAVMISFGALFAVLGGVLLKRR